MKVNAGTIARTAVLAVSLLNVLLKAALKADETLALERTETAESEAVHHE